MRDEPLAVARPFRARVVKEQKTVAQAGHAGRDDVGIDRNLLPAVGVGRSRVGHSPDRAARAEHHGREIASFARSKERPGYCRALNDELPFCGS